MSETIQPSGAREPEGDEGVLQGRKSTITKLKDSRDAAVHSATESAKAAEYYQSQYNNVVSKLGELEGKLSTLDRANNPQGIEDYPTRDLENVAFSSEVGQTEAMKAYDHLNKRRFNESEKSMMDRVEELVDSRLSERSRNQLLQQHVGQTYARVGEGNIAPGTELYTKAQSHYNSLLNMIDMSDPKSVKNVLQLAAVNLVDAENRTASQKPNSNTLGLPPADQYETRSDAQAPVQNDYKEALDKGKLGEAARIAISQWYQ